MKIIQTWVITFGELKAVFYTEYHAEQFARALRLNGTFCTLSQMKR